MNRSIIVVLMGAIFWLTLSTGVYARYLNEDRSLQVKGKIQTKLSFTTNDTKGWWTVPSLVPDQVDPPNLDAGDLIQHRNIAYLELDYDFGKKSDYDIKVHATGRFMYEGVYEYGPDEIQAVRDADPGEIDDFTRDADIWELYADYTQGPWFLRTGRQKISWGETDVYPLLDRIMPIDDTYGGIFEDLDDRRIPLWAVRSTYNFGRVGGVESLSLEGFWEPAALDPQFAPSSPWGSIYNFPQPSAPPYTERIEPDDTMADSRYGIRVQGIIANNFNWALAHYQSYMDTPALRLRVDPSFLLGDPHGLVMEQHFKPIRVTGGSFSFFESVTSAVIRGEVAYFHDESAFNPLFNLAPMVTGGPATIPEWDVIRFSLAVDRAFWARFINKKGMIQFSLELFNEHYLDYEDGYALAAPEWPSGDFVKLHEWEQTLVNLIYTDFMSGRLTPTILSGYNLRGSGFIQPSVQYRMDPFIFKLHYANFFGKEDIAPGLLFDQEQVSMIVTLLF